MVGRAAKQAFIGLVLTSILTGLVGCNSLPPKIEPTPEPTKHRKVVRTTPPTKVAKRKKGIVNKVNAKKVVAPAEEASEPEKPPVIPALGGSGSGGSGGGSAGGHSW
ncbi:hypothetical protein [Mesorhizobium sp. B2-1-3A]|uniref:hypothetical protein n=1 Tax=Mesorhizobium sp. B2-1-3A TaxID=2589971 RepID=UPI00112BB87C|nr:hypothetical protein [Mesorhizobium sp. B2-1-3A]TPM93824.1 hypothetical protein FJ977_26870 [Mesorhizobium sp. B2-1-3A]